MLMIWGKVSTNLVYGKGKASDIVVISHPKHTSCRDRQAQTSESPSTQAETKEHHHMHDNITTQYPTSFSVVRITVYNSNKHYAMKTEAVVWQYQTVHGACMSCIIWRLPKRKEEGGRLGGAGQKRTRSNKQACSHHAYLYTSSPPPKGDTPGRLQTIRTAPSTRACGTGSMYVDNMLPRPARGGPARAMDHLSG
jgi:hypothetical protein